MKKFLAAVAVVTVLGMLATPALAIEWTGKVTEIYPDSLVFVVDKEGQEAELWLGPEPAETLVKTFGELNVGDTVKVDFNEEEAIAMAIVVVKKSEPGQRMPQASEPQTQKQGPKTGSSY